MPACQPAISGTEEWFLLYFAISFLHNYMHSTLTECCKPSKPSWEDLFYDFPYAYMITADHFDRKTENGWSQREKGCGAAMRLRRYHCIFGLMWYRPSFSLLCPQLLQVVCEHCDEIISSPFPIIMHGISHDLLQQKGRDERFLFLHTI